jgi:hypothetical protein
MKNQHQNNIKQMLYNSHLIKESNQRKSSTDDIATHPCTRLDWAFVVSPFQQLSLDA